METTERMERKYIISKPVLEEKRKKVINLLENRKGDQKKQSRNMVIKERYMHPNVNSSTIYNSQDIEKT